MIRELKYKSFDTFSDYDNWHKLNYHANEGIKETGLWFGNDGRFYTQYINVTLN